MEVGVGLFNNTLFIVGSPTRDNLSVALAHHKILLSGSLGGSRIHQAFRTANVHGIFAMLGSGNDLLTFRGNPSRPIVVEAGAGNDRITTVGSAVISGGDGDDVLTGGQGRDLLIGGAGRDRLYGNGGSDILIGGSTAYDEELISLLGLEVEWVSPRTLTERLQNIRTGSGATLQPRNVRLNSQGTVFDDGAADALFGGPDQDWFWAVSGENRSDRKAAEPLG
jgi:Ca2+-binding RTX toxin-like protein